MATKFNEFFSKIGTSISDSVIQTEKSPDDYIADYPDNKPKFSLDNLRYYKII